VSKPEFIIEKSQYIYSNYDPYSTIAIRLESFIWAAMQIISIPSDNDARLGDKAAPGLA
jgi:hypothetical protein